MPSTLSPEIRLKTAYGLAFSPDSRRVAFIGGRYVTMLDIGTCKALFAVHPIANPSRVDFSPDGRRLVVKGTSGRTIILAARPESCFVIFAIRGRERAIPQFLRRAHASSFPSLGADFSVSVTA
jgi:hypothetical protein